MLEQMGNWGYQVGALGILAFTIAFLVIVRWWTDILGRVIAGVFSATSGVLIMSTLRMLEFDKSATFFTWRLVVFWTFGLGVWTGLGTFVWAQFFAPRIKGTMLTRVPKLRMETRREYNDEEADLADSGPGGDDAPHRHSGGHP